MEEEVNREGSKKALRRVREHLAASGFTMNRERLPDTRWEHRNGVQFNFMLVSGELEAFFSVTVRAFGKHLKFKVQEPELLVMVEALSDHSRMPLCLGTPMEPLVKLWAKEEK